jgi:RNA polymerase sigma factor (sigma-70 family)
MFDQVQMSPIARQPMPPSDMVADGAKRFGKTAGQARVSDTGQTDWAALLMQVARTQDADAFAMIFEYYAPRVKAFLMKGGADHAVAEECAQDVMVTVWNKAGQFDPTRASVATWIYTIARNRRIDMLRRDRRPEPEELTWGPEAEPDQFDALSLQQDTQKLAEALSQLPEKQRQMIESAYFGDLTHNEIADATGLPLGTIKSRIRLALERLRHSLS